MAFFVSTAIIFCMCEVSRAENEYIYGKNHIYNACRVNSRKKICKNRVFSAACSRRSSAPIAAILVSFERALFRLQIAATAVRICSLVTKKTTPEQNPKYAIPLAAART